MSDMNAAAKPNFVRLELTAEQKETVRRSTGMDASAIELSAKELEERIAPRVPQIWADQ